MSTGEPDELLAQLVVWVISSSTTGALLWADRRRLPPEARALMWRGTTVAIAVSGLFLPSPLTFGAHVWVTRRGQGWSRLPRSLLGTALAVGLTLGPSEAVLTILDWMTSSPPLPP
jgi:hypothetical protein